jgi:hypothetical protein
MHEDLWIDYCRAVRDWKPKVRIEIANRGEPTMHPQFIRFIRIARKLLPQAQFLVSTNGDLVNVLGLPLFREWVAEAQAEGVNCFLLDCYTPKRLREFTVLFKGAADLFFGDEAMSPYGYRGPNWRALIIKDATTYKSELGRVPRENVILHYHNQGGFADVGPGRASKIYPNVRPVAAPLARMCVRPFREMPMWFDGSVPFCCDDWGDAHIIGSFPERSLPDLWDAYDEVRANLIARDRGAQKPCDKCTEGQGKRFGLELSWFTK